MKPARSGDEQLMSYRVPEDQRSKTDQSSNGNNMGINVGQCHVYHPPVITTIFVSGMCTPFPGKWVVVCMHCFTH